MSEQPTAYQSPNTIAPPPTLLKWLVWLLVIGGVLTVVGASIGIYAFREWVPPRYQVTYSAQFPILQVVLPDGPAANTVLPTPQVEVTSSVPLEALLGAPAESTEEAFDEPTEAAPAEAATVEGDAVAENAVVMVPTATTTAVPTDTPTETLPTPTSVPPTAAPSTSKSQSVAAPTEVIAAAEPTAETVAMVSSTLPLPPANARNFGFTYVQQSWNNCGPANITMALSYYGWRNDQRYAQSRLRGAIEDRNVTPGEMVDFVNADTQVRALYRVGGDMETLKRLVAAEFPVVIETGTTFEGSEWLGHYQTVVGYDNGAGEFYVYDSWIPSDQGLPIEYDEFDRWWQHFTRTFIVLYPPERENEVMRLLGPLESEREAYMIALQTAQQSVREDPTNGFALFNLGRAYTYLEDYSSAAAAFDRARMAGVPWRMMWYAFEPFEAYLETERYSDVLALVESNATTLGTGGYVEETWYWAGRVHEAQGNQAEAASNYRRALQQNTRFDQAEAALERVS